MIKDEALKKMRIITSFASFAKQPHSPQPQEALVTRSDSPNVNNDISLPALTKVHSTAKLDTGIKSEICAEFVEKEQIIAVHIENSGSIYCILLLNSNLNTVVLIT